MASCPSRPGRASVSLSTKTWCGTRTRIRTAGGTRSGERRTAALPNGSLGYPANPSLGDTSVALIVHIVELAAKLLNLCVRCGKIGAIVALVERRFFLVQFAEVADR